MRSILIHIAAMIAAALLPFYEVTYRRDLGNWRRDCSCVGDISSWQDGQ